jgi:CheY-like chemotaxis protein
MDAIDVEAQRMTILKALERGDIDVTEATDRLAALEGTAR